MYVLSGIKLFRNMLPEPLALQQFFLPRGYPGFYRISPELQGKRQSIFSKPARTCEDLKGRCATKKRQMLAKTCRIP